MKRQFSGSLKVMTLALAGVMSTTAVAFDEANGTGEAPLTPVPIEDPVTETDVATEAVDIPHESYPEARSVGCVCGSCGRCASAKKAAATAKMKGAYKGLFFDNDFSYLNDPCYNGPNCCGDALKGLCCGRLDIGGEARVRYHSEDNIRGLGLTGRDDDFWLTRFRLYADYHMNDYFRFYGEYLYADSGGEFFNNRPIEENRGEMQNLFVDVNLTEKLGVRAGRQELLYGAQRLVSPLDWANTRRTFDGAKFMYQGDTWNLDGFWTRPVKRTQAYEDKLDPTDDQIDFFGLYASRSDLAIGNLDAYYIGLVDDRKDFSYHTLGTRVWGASEGGLLYEFEGGYQFGENSPGYGDHNAGFATGGLGHQWNVCTSHGMWKPTTWIWYDWASGGDDVPAARGDDGFDHLYPLAHKYLGFMDLFGRRNINDVNAQFITPVFGDKVKLLIWYHYFFLDQKTTPYNVVMGPYNPGFTAGSKDLGHEIDVLFNIALNPRNSMLVGYSFFDAGRYFQTTQGIPNTPPPGNPRGNNDAQFFYMQYQTRF